MKKTVWTFGLIAGAILSVMMVATIPFVDRIGYERAEVLGYTTIIAAFLLIFFGIRSYRDNQTGRAVSFGRALVVGVLINVVASACYVATWQVIYYKFAPNFMEQMAEHTIEKERARGASEAQIAEKQAELQKFRELYRNPLVNIAVTFLEPFVVGLVVALVSAGILRRRRSPTALAEPFAAFIQ